MQFFSPLDKEIDYPGDEDAKRLALINCNQSEWSHNVGGGGGEGFGMSLLIPKNFHHFINWLIEIYSKWTFLFLLLSS